MEFSLFAPLVAKHLRKSREYLADAKLKQVKHEAAAERHRALTELYAERIRRSESDISQALQAVSSSHPADLPCRQRQRACGIRSGAGVSDPRFARLSLAPTRELEKEKGQGTPGVFV